MKSFAVLLTGLVASVVSQGLPQPSGCPALPPVIANLTQGVPIKPRNIPRGCNPFEVLVARGTGEPDFAQGGKFGVVVGDPVISNLTKVLPFARGYPVQDPASGNASSPRIGADDVVRRLKRQSRLCPTQRFALVGYSQGAAVIRLAASELPQSILCKIVAFVGYGDPARRVGRENNLPALLQDRDTQVCAGVGTPDSDPVCDANGRGCFFFHLTYIQQNFIDQGVNFLASSYRNRTRGFEQIACFFGNNTGSPGAPGNRTRRAELTLSD